ncbi:MAG: N-glycosylase/DNA lyase [Candidatus Micrarchaeota archaeon]|nr:N-glycosylase/DNA lyase [Candidatus Micrarchaeota archaeon]
MLDASSLARACRHKHWHRKQNPGQEVCRLAAAVARECAPAMPLIEERWGELARMQRASGQKWFEEMCFCLLTANASAEMGMRVQQRLGYGGFAKTPPARMAAVLKKAGSRFYNTRARYILLARKHDGQLKKKVRALGSPYRAREWLVGNVKGMGYKEASHFLRNVGYGDVAILDKHVLSLLREYGLIGDFKTMSKRRYIAVEHVLRQVSDAMHMPLGKLDLCLWYMKTGKVLK